MQGRLEGKVCYITGAASGIGRACVDKLLANGAVVIALDIAQGFEESFSSPAVLAIHCDVTDKLSIEQALQNAVCRFGGIDVLVSNAGNFPPNPPPISQGITLTLETGTFRTSETCDLISNGP